MMAVSKHSHLARCSGVAASVWWTSVGTVLSTVLSTVLQQTKPTELGLSAGRRLAKTAKSWLRAGATI